MANAITMSFSCSFDDPGSAASFMASLSAAMEQLKSTVASAFAPSVETSASVQAPARKLSAVQSAKAARVEAPAAPVAEVPAVKPEAAVAPVSAPELPLAMAAVNKAPETPVSEAPAAATIETLRGLVRKIAAISAAAVTAMATALGTFNVTRIGELKESDYAAAAAKLELIVREHSKA